ncbi:MAG: hypothetical protein MHM6MM_001356 [Cercozoa sp. M6MM]
MHGEILWTIFWLLLVGVRSQTPPGKDLFEPCAFDMECKAGLVCESNSTALVCSLLPCSINGDCGTFTRRCLPSVKLCSAFESCLIDADCTNNFRCTSEGFTCKETGNCDTDADCTDSILFSSPQEKRTFLSQFDVQIAPSMLLEYLSQNDTALCVSKTCLFPGMVDSRRMDQTLNLRPTADATSGLSLRALSSAVPGEEYDTLSGLMLQRSLIGAAWFNAQTTSVTTLNRVFSSVKYGDGPELAPRSRFTAEIEAVARLFFADEIRFAPEPAGDARLRARRFSGFACLSILRQINNATQNVSEVFNLEEQRVGGSIASCMRVDRTTRFLGSSEDRFPPLTPIFVPADMCAARVLWNGDEGFLRNRSFVSGPPPAEETAGIVTNNTEEYSEMIVNACAFTQSRAPTDPTRQSPTQGTFDQQWVASDKQDSLRVLYRARPVRFGAVVVDPRGPLHQRERVSPLVILQRPVPGEANLVSESFVQNDLSSELKVHQQTNATTVQLLVSFDRPLPPPVFDSALSPMLQDELYDPMTETVRHFPVAEERPGPNGATPPIVYLRLSVDGTCISPIVDRDLPCQRVDYAYRSRAQLGAWKSPASNTTRSTLPDDVSPGVLKQQRMSPEQLLRRGLAQLPREREEMRRLCVAQVPVERLLESDSICVYWNDTKFVQRVDLLTITGTPPNDFKSISGRIRFSGPAMSVYEVPVRVRAMSTRFVEACKTLETQCSRGQVRVFVDPTKNTLRGDPQIDDSALRFECRRVPQNVGGTCFLADADRSRDVNRVGRCSGTGHCVHRSFILRAQLASSHECMEVINDLTLTGGTASDPEVQRPFPLVDTMGTVSLHETPSDSSDAVVLPPLAAQSSRRSASMLGELLWLRAQKRVLYCQRTFHFTLVQLADPRCSDDGSVLQFKWAVLPAFNRSRSARLLSELCALNIAFSLQAAALSARSEPASNFAAQILRTDTRTAFSRMSLEQLFGGAAQVPFNQTVANVTTEAPPSFDAVVDDAVFRAVAVRGESISPGSNQGVPQTESALSLEEFSQQMLETHERTLDIVLSARGIAVETNIAFACDREELQALVQDASERLFQEALFEVICTRVFGVERRVQVGDSCALQCNSQVGYRRHLQRADCVFDRDKNMPRWQLRGAPSLSISAENMQLFLTRLAARIQCKPDKSQLVRIVFSVFLSLGVAGLCASLWLTLRHRHLKIQTQSTESAANSQVCAD